MEEVLAEKGRPTKYDPKFCEQARKFCLLGATNQELADFFEVSVSSIDKWLRDYEDFSSAVKDGREVADSKIAESLYKRALGYSHEEDKIFCSNGEIVSEKTIKHYPPDSTALSFWLRNRRPDKWREKQEVQHSGDNLTFEIKSAKKADSKDED